MCIELQFTAVSAVRAKLIISWPEVGMTRRKVREHLFHMLFESGFHGEQEINEQYDFYWAGQIDEATDEEYIEIKDKLSSIIDKISEIDKLIETNSKGWKLNRIGNTDRNILRIAIYEMKWDDSVPLKVAINEAVELAKLYGIENSPGFINGILSQIAKQFGED